jgi:hypothetical protein
LIAYEVKAPVKAYVPTPLRSIREVVEERRRAPPPNPIPQPIIDARRLGEEIREEAQRALAEGEKPKPRGPAIPWEPLGMGKMEYAHWLNAHVYPNFPVGTLVTLRSIPVMLNHAPSTVFVVKDIVEVHYMAHLDVQTRQPRSVGVCRLDELEQRGSVFYSPKQLRILYPEEKRILDSLRNQSAEPKIVATNSQSATPGYPGDGEGRPQEGDI